MRTLVTRLAATLALAAGACADAPTASPVAAPRPSADVSQTPDQHQTERFDVRVTEHVPCTNGGEGELVTFEGAILEQYHVRRDATGRVRIRIQQQLQGMRGTGWETGTAYVALGTFHSKETYVDPTVAPVTFAFSNAYAYVSAGNEADFVRRVQGRYVLNPDGTVVREDVRESVECR
jgi:hypothetical protein